MKNTATTTAAAAWSYPSQWYEGDRPNLNWCAFLMHLERQGRLLKEPKLKQKLFRK